MSRLERLKEMLAADPKDVFLRYAMGMELKGLDQHPECIEIFQGLMRESPPHVPSFFMAGQALVASGLIDEARAVLRDGIDEARRQKDLHAAGEMSEFLASLGVFGE
jgi:predicted Zn-dependent protease